ncbi:hypothetical protein DL98DRAFT_598027 [Cadophora sp. DSE1049]|nr:hypothetical protein DL98DRAFT_598027 [Cadophora sp. DSE1049]
MEGEAAKEQQHFIVASPETQLSQEGHLHTGRGVADEHELVDHALDTFLIDEGARRQQEVEQEQEKDKGNSEDGDEGPQQEMNVVAPVVTAERAGGSPRPADRRQSLPNLDPSLEPSHNEAGSRCGRDSNDELNSSDSAGDDKKEPRPAKRKQPSSSHSSPARKKRRRPFQQSPLRQRRPPIDEQRLLAYKKERKSWKWIFRQFPGRTQPAVRTRLNIVQARGE